MNTFEQTRRSFLFTVGSLRVSQILSQGTLQGHVAPRQGYVLGPGDGEHLVHFRDQGNIFIKRHFKMDEAFLVLEGSGTFILNDVRHSFEKGGTIFIPKKSWHGFENPEHELLLLWVVSPAGLDGFFRETCTPPGVPPKQLTRDQIKAIALKYDTEFR